MLFLTSAAIANDTVSYIEKLGFPIFVTIVLGLFLYKVWDYVTRKLDEKDALIERQITHNEKFSDEIVNTQTTHGKILIDVRNILRETSGHKHSNYSGD